MHVKTRTNVQFEEPLNYTVSLKITYDEYIKLKTVSSQNNISISELSRNLIREHVSNYAMSVNLSKYLRISAEIDKFLIEKRLIVSKKASSLSKIREILTDFEENLELPIKKIDYHAVKNDGIRILGLIKFIYETDDYISNKIDQQARRILRNKTFKGLDIKVDGD